MCLICDRLLVFLRDLQVLVQESQFPFVSVLAMVTLLETVAFVGIGGIVVGLPRCFQRGGEFLRLLWRHLRIFFSMQAQQWSLDLRNIGKDVGLAIDCGLLLRRTSHLGLPADGGVSIRI